MLRRQICMASLLLFAALSLSIQFIYSQQLQAIEVVPVQTRKAKPLHGSVTVRGDIVGPVLEAWDVERS